MADSSTKKVFTLSHLSRENLLSDNFSIDKHFCMENNKLQLPPGIANAP